MTEIKPLNRVPSLPLFLGRLPGVVILEANDIVFAEVLAILNLDEHQVDDAGILQAVRRAVGNVGRLIAAEHQFAIAADNLRRTGNYNPMLAPVVVHLQA